MCVIIIREPDVTIPLDKLKIACDINKHGYGLAYVHRRRLKVERSIENNDADAIFKRMEELKEYRVFLHLRHATVGNVSLENSHPFLVLEHKKEAVDVGFMHNGTLHLWTPNHPNTAGISDSKNFAAEFVQPMAARSHAFFGRSVLKDPFFINRTAKEIGATSVVVFFDSLGETRIFNKDAGKDFEGWWASNEYSFRETHHRSSSSKNRQNWWEDGDHIPFKYTPPADRFGKLPKFNYGPANIQLSDLIQDQGKWMAGWETELVAADKHEEISKILHSMRNVSYIECSHQSHTVKQFIATAMIDTPEDAMASKIEQLHTKRPSFVEEMEMTDITDMLTMTQETFVLLCQKCPNAMSEAWMELSGELFKAREEIKKLKAGK